jgi:tRNA dimethylallyltransferase
MTRQLPLVAIVGPTASGKTGLAIELAERFGGEIISADSRAIFRGMDIGTAKPTLKEQARVPHWGLDLVEPGEVFTVADFKVYATQKIDEIRSRGRIPFLVGGTGLYIDAVIFDYQFGTQADLGVRRELERLSIEELQQYCIKNNIALPENKQNKRHLMRAIERGGDVGSRRQTPVENSIIVGIATDREVLRERIAKRVEQLFDDGVVEEATMLGKKYGWDNEAMTGNIYQVLHAYLDGVLTLDETKQQNIVLDWRLAKRQLTWLRRNQYITWFPLDEARRHLEEKLA